MASRSKVAIMGFASLVIDPMDILGEKRRQFERWEGVGFFELRNR